VRDVDIAPAELRTEIVIGDQIHEVVLLDVVGEKQIERLRYVIACLTKIGGKLVRRVRVDQVDDACPLTAPGIRRTKHASASSIHSAEPFRRVR